jgi:phospholipid/cholesterol/gamma-HCH transport system substrate-binding protein
MSELTRNFIIGLVSIVALIGFAALLMFFGELDLLPRKEYSITINMNVASGLRQGSPVQLNGVHIGSVAHVSLHESPPDARYPVRVVAMIKDIHRIPHDVDARVNQSLLAGTAVLQLHGSMPAEPTPDQFLVTDGKAQLFVFERPLLDEIRAELDDRTKPLIEALDSFNKLSATYIALGENLNELVRPLEPDDGDEDVVNVRRAMAKFNEVLDDAREALRLVNYWLADEQLLADAKQAVANARTLTEQATKTIEQYGKLAEKLHGDTDDVLMAILPVADEMAMTLAEVRVLLTTATEGRGTVAQLLKNPDLYQSLQDAAERLEQALTEVRLFIQKVKSEGLPTRIW